MAKRIILPTIEIEHIRTMYVDEKMSITQIAQTTNYSGGFIRRVMKDNNIIARSISEAKIIYPVCDPLYFHDADTEEKAYFLGFLYADGNVRSKTTENAITIKLKREDTSLLQRLSLIIYGYEHLYFYTEYDQTGEPHLTTTLKFTNAQMKNDLIYHGCMPAKSLILQWPKYVPDHLLHHFVRGYFDGDGSIYLDDDNYCIGIVMTSDFCQSLVRLLDGDSISVNYSIQHHKEMLERGNDITVHLLIRGNRQVFKFANWMYQDATIYLERKHQRYQELCREIQRVDQKNRAAQERIVLVLALDKEGKRNKEIAQITGLSKSRVSTIIHSHKSLKLP